MKYAVNSIGHTFLNKKSSLKPVSSFIWQDRLYDKWHRYNMQDNMYVPGQSTDTAVFRTLGHWAYGYGQLLAVLVVPRNFIGTIESSGTVELAL